MEYALGWAVLIGLTASINLLPTGPRQTQPVRDVELTHAALVPHAAAASQTPMQAQAMPTHDLEHLPQSQRVQKWYAAFDDIRERAKMSPMEKASAIRLWASSFVTTSESDKNDARMLMSSLEDRYTRASAELAALPKIPETHHLQSGYAQFFSQAKKNFGQYVSALDQQSTKTVLSQMSRGRQQLASIDVRNKNLDRRLRSQFGIPEID